MARIQRMPVPEKMNLGSALQLNKLNSPFEQTVPARDGRSIITRSIRRQFVGRIVRDWQRQIIKAGGVESEGHVPPRPSTRLII